MNEKKIKLQNKNLRRNLELMKAQLSANGEITMESAAANSESTQSKKSYRVSGNNNASQSTQKRHNSGHEVLEINTSYLKKDLLKTFVLTTLAFATIFFIHFKNLF